MTDRAGIAVLVGAALRQARVDAPLAEVISFAEALDVVGLGWPPAVYAAAEACFARSPEERPIVADVLTAVMRAFGDLSAWREGADHVLVGSGGLLLMDRTGAEDGAGRDGAGRDGAGRDPAEEDAAEEDAAELLVASEESAGDEEQPGEEGVGEEAFGTVVASAVEVLREKDFGACSEEELEEISRLMPRLGRLVPTHRGRRMVMSRRAASGLPDLRRTVRRSFSSGGEPMSLARRRRGHRARRVVLLVDVSGSMAPYARALLRFCHAAIVSQRRVEAFLLATRCTRVTRQLAWRDPSAALVQAERAAPDMSGGTRLGEGLRTFNDDYGTGGMAHGAVVVVCSDGWDRGDPAMLAEQMERLSRVAHRLIWVNPLKASTGYEPLARGMAAALPYVDRFVSGHSLEALEELANEIAA